MEKIILSIILVLMALGVHGQEKKQTPLPPYAYATEEVSFTNAEDHAVLSGTLSYPFGYEKMEKNAVPVVLMISGSGLQNRDEELFGHKPFLVIADYLAKHGIASLRYDDRNFGKSTGNVTEATTETFMKDALAGIDFLKKSGQFGKIGVIGHSEGGSIAFMLASRKSVDFVVSLAGSGVRGDLVLLAQNRTLLSTYGIPDQVCTDYCNVLKGIFQAQSAKPDIANPKELVKELIEKTQAKLPPSLEQNLVMVIKLSNPWSRYFISYDPGKDIAKTHCPVMAINGSKDMQIDAKTNLEAIQTLLPANTQNLIKEYPGLNHLFQHSETGNPAEYANIEETIAPEVLEDVANWINQTSK